jgi:hypothetical protein
MSPTEPGTTFEDGTVGPTTYNIFNETGAAVGKYHVLDSQYVQLGGDFFNRDWIAALVPEPDGVRVYLTGVERNFFIRGATVEDLLGVLR